MEIGKQISVVMITLNEEQSIQKVVNDIWSESKDIEIIIVDSSLDKTAEIAQNLGVKVIKQFPPKGYSPAMDLALKSASRKVIITLDCDDTYPTNMILPFANKILNDNYDMVDGDRLSKKPKNMPLINFLANKFFAIIASIMFFVKLNDLHSGMRAYRKEIIEKLPYLPISVSLPVELILWPIRLNMKLFIQPIEYRERIGNSKLEPIKAAWWTIIRILRARFKKID
tara:strand:+ start:304 stop:984 length:681 start_codon:yes stop_codon:yes gene_type:complete